MERGVELAEGGRLVGPANRNDLETCFRLINLLGRHAARPAASRLCAVKHQTFYLVVMFDRVTDGHRCAAGHPKQRIAIEASRMCDGLEVFDVPVERKVINRFPVRETATPPV